VTASAEPVFFYDLSSPYAYLAAERIDAVLPLQARWQPIVFGALLRARGRTPWSLQDETRGPGQAEVAARARERGLPAVRWPDGWPAESYSVTPLRAVLHAQEQGRGKELTLALYRAEFAEGRALDDLDAVLSAVEACGLDPDDVRKGVQRQEIKDSLRAATDDAIARGVPGVPTIAVGDELYWGDDRLEEAAAALSA
jgi:2-hydroxychromene-2-carboxylate isomerase